MAIPYPFVTDNPQHINTGSYLNKTETGLFVSGYSDDVWYGLSERDAMEVSVFDLDQNQLGWDTLNTDKNFRTVSLTYLNTLDQTVSYTYSELQSDFILYKNSKILVNPIEQLSSSFGILSGSYLVSYNFIREMAGNPSASLIIKDISPSRRELKIIPAAGNTPQYEAFCQKKIQIKDVSPLFITLTNKCPYEQIYNQIKDSYQNEIAFLKQLLFLNGDGAVIDFIRNLYEDVVIYTSPGNSDNPVQRIQRTQGIRTYYQNFLLSNYETISNFDEIQTNFNTFTTYRVNLQFLPYGTQTGSDFTSAQQFLMDFFIKFFYGPISFSTQAAFDDKYFSFFKNVLNFGNNQMLTVVDHSFMDERTKPTDPLTLLIKLKSELPEDIQKQTACWVSNVSLTPYVVNIILKSPSSATTIRISAPNFSLEGDTLSLYNVNQSYTAADLAQTAADQQNIDINKTLNELFIDYTSFSNFVIFSSAQQRLKNFKTKIAQWTMLSSSLVTLNSNASASNAVGTSYPYYGSERGSIEGQMTEIINSFDGYESYLFNTGSYAYDPTKGKFVNSQYVADQDQAALYYDKTNQDSLINNSPEHIVMDSDNDDYLTFLMMTGHFFDNIYLYITNLPSERIVNNDPQKTFSKKVIDYMLDAFGWKVGNSYEDMSALDVFTTSSGSLVSAEDRTKAIRTRLLTTLPQIYKAKGTEEAIRLLLACHGIPSELLSVREYGGDDYSTGSLVTYRLQDRACLIGFSASYDPNDGYGSVYITEQFTLRPNLRTIEFKVAMQNPGTYTPHVKYPIVREDHYYTTMWDNTPSSSVPSGQPINPVQVMNFQYLVDYYRALGHYYPNTPLTAWSIGFWREYGQMGRIFAALGTGSLSFNRSNVYLTSSLLPLFDGDIFNVMLRRRDPFPSYEFSSNQETVPTEYDLVVQRNEGGRTVFRSEYTQLGEFPDNMIWDGITGDTIFDQTGSYLSQQNSTIVWGTDKYALPIDFAIGNTMTWDVAITDADFDVHCNDFSSYAHSGSDIEKHLITRMNYDEPVDFLGPLQDFDCGYFGYPFLYGAGIIPNRSDYYSTFTDIYGYPNSTGFVASGSWNGSKTGSLLYIENLSGSFSASVSGSLSGSGIGWFSYPYDGIQSTPFFGQIDGTMYGAFNSSVVQGQITSSDWMFHGFLSGSWNGNVGYTDFSNPSGFFHGIFSGSASGSFNGDCFGSMTGSEFPNSRFYGHRKGGVWSGQLTGSINGIIFSDNMTGSFSGIASGSITSSAILPSPMFSGSYSKVWFGSFTGSSYGNFFGATGYSRWTGSNRAELYSPIFDYQNPPYPVIDYYGGIGNLSGIFTGSFYGWVSSSYNAFTLTYATGAFSGSFIQGWTGSSVSLYNKTPMPFQITYNGFGIYPYNQYYYTASYDNFCFNDCVPFITTGSQWPYQFLLKNIEKIYTSPKYGPNRFKNQKIKQKAQEVAARLDDQTRSTFDEIEGVQSDSNLIGLYLDPQDAKNKDIIHFLGNWNVMDLIADPANQYSSSYSALKTLNNFYNSFGDRKVLYNELITLYKIYFNRSVFDSVQNVLPARASTRTGVLVEPTVLERPKYQRKEIFSEVDTGSVAYYDVTLTHYAGDPVTKLVRFSGSKDNTSDGQMTLLWGEFNLDTASLPNFNASTLPSNLTMDINVSYINEANFIYPNNYVGGYYDDIMDDWQLGNFATLGSNLGFQFAEGVVTDKNGNESFMVKQWDKYTIYFKSGSYVRDSIKAEDTYVSNSIWLYKIVGFSADQFNRVFYSQSFYEPSESLSSLAFDSDTYIIAGNTYYYHRANTAKGTPNQRLNAVKGTDIHSGLLPVVAGPPFFNIAEGTYFETFGGYPQNHYTHKMQWLTPIKIQSINGKAPAMTSTIYVRNSQTDTTTIGTNGLNDGSLPVQTIQTSNVNLTQGTNVINQ